MALQPTIHLCQKQQPVDTRHLLAWILGLRVDTAVKNAGNNFQRALASIYHNSAPDCVSGEAPGLHDLLNKLERVLDNSHINFLLLQLLFLFLFLPLVLIFFFIFYMHLKLHFDILVCVLQSPSNFFQNFCHILLYFQISFSEDMKGFLHILATQI